MNKLRSVLKKRRAKEDPRVRRRLFSWRMFAMTLLVVSVLSAGNVFALEKLLKMQVFSVVASMGVGSYWVAMAFLAAIVLHLYTCRRFDRPMRALSRAMRQVTEGDFTVRVKPFHNANKFDYMDIMCEDFNRMVQELAYMMRISDEKEEERFKALDETLRAHQKENKGKAEAAAARMPFFRKKRFGRSGKKL